MEENKRVITPEFLLKKNVGNAAVRGIRTIVGIVVLGFLCLFIFLIVGFWGLLIDAVMAAWFIFSKVNDKKKVMNAYFRTMTVVDKRVRKSDNDDSLFGYNEINFGKDAKGHDLWVDAPVESEYNEAKPGDHFYVGFYGDSNNAFTCYSCEKNALDPALELR